MVVARITIFSVIPEYLPSRNFSWCPPVKPETPLIAKPSSWRDQFMAAVPFLRERRGFFQTRLSIFFFFVNYGGAGWPSVVLIFSHTIDSRLHKENGAGTLHIIRAFACVPMERWNSPGFMRDERRSESLFWSLEGLGCLTRRAQIIDLRFGRVTKRVSRFSLFDNHRSISVPSNTLDFQNR